MSTRAADPAVPVNSLVLGYGPMLPLVAAAIGAWTVPDLAATAVRLAIVWGALILAFIAGVRRGFGFGNDGASTTVEIATSIGYFVLAGLALVAPFASMALSLLIVGYAAAAVFDTRSAQRGNAPAHFARLRPYQMLLGAAALVVLWSWVRFGA